MAKQWRNLNAQFINQLRAQGANIPTARVLARQRHSMKSAKGATTWLLDGLLIRAGIIDPLPPMLRYLSKDTAPWRKSVIARVIQKVKGWWNK